ncbi:enhancer of variegation 3-9 [Cochliomyia hominivorax]
MNQGYKNIMEEIETDNELMENIIACRTCGIHYVTPNKYQLKHLFQSSLENSEIMLIRLELAQWNVEVAENDGYPQHVCNTCIHKFEQVFSLRAACINAQNEFRKFYNVPNGNLSNITIKTERKDQDDEEQPICDFIYVDDLSDTEYDGATPFNIPHVPIKEEVIEAATIPIEEESKQPTNINESAAGVVLQTENISPHIPEMKTQNESMAVEPTSSAVAVELPIEEVGCKLCHHMSPSQEDHKQHMQRAHEIRDIECHICGKEFKNATPARLKFHMKWHTLNKHVKCTLCGFVCSSKDALREHKRANHSKINCKICGKGVLAKKMKSHLRRHELLNKFNCEYCTEAFSSEIERENHIWQIHANEDITANNISISSMPLMAHTSQELNEDILREQQTAEDVIYAQTHDVDDNLLNYKFLCAHCDQRFIEQIDLETHVKQEHRYQTQQTTAEEATEINENAIINSTEEIMHHEEDVNNDNEHANITVFKDYDNDGSIHVPTNETSLVNQTEHLENKEMETYEQSEEDRHELNEEASDSASSDDDQDEETNDSESEDDTISTVVTPAFVEENINTFACAKCSETFVTIEQLRQHYEKHLAAAVQEQEHKKLTPTKSQFKCNLCGKCFDLKFSLNRHVKKHKIAPI